MSDTSEKLRERVIAFTNCRDDLDARALDDALDALISYTEAKARVKEANEWREDWLSGRLDGHERLKRAKDALAAIEKGDAG